MPSTPLAADELAAREAHMVRGQVLDTVRRRIITGEIGPGQRLNEAEIARGLGISRGPVREAIQRLASEGLLRIEAHRGAFVRSFAADEVRELFEVRVALESTAARLAAAAAPPEHLRRLRTMIAETGHAIGAQAEPHYPEDLDLHDAIAAASGNARLRAMIHDLHRQLRLARSRSGYAPGNARDAFEEHVAVVEAVCARREVAAEQAMRRHLSAALRRATAIQPTRGERARSDQPRRRRR